MLGVSSGSVALQVTVVVPTANNEPGAGVQTTGATSPPSSAAVAL